MELIKFKKILVPFDFNECYDSAFKVAEEIAVKTNASLTLLHAINPIWAAGRDLVASVASPLSDHDSIFDSCEKSISEYLEKSPLTDKQLTIKVETGDINTRVLEHGSSGDYDLIVMPDFRKSALARIAGELNVLDIMEKTKIPVIAVNRVLNKFSLKKVILPIRNVKNWFHKVPFIASLSKITGAKIFLIALDNSASKATQKQVADKLKFCAEYLDKYELNYESEHVYCHGEPYFDVLTLAKYKNADLIALSPPVEYRKLNSYTNSNFYNNVISKGETPVLGITLT